MPSARQSLQSPAVAQSWLEVQVDPQEAAVTGMFSFYLMKQLISLLAHLCWQVLAPVPSARQSLQLPAEAQSWLEVHVLPQVADET